MRGDPQLGTYGEAELLQPQAAEAQVRDGLIAAVIVGAGIAGVADGALAWAAWAAGYR